MVKDVDGGVSRKGDKIKGGKCHLPVCDLVKNYPVREERERANTMHS